jgi:hypothetical protein
MSLTLNVKVNDYVILGCNNFDLIVIVVSDSFPILQRLWKTLTNVFEAASSSYIVLC